MSLYFHGKYCTISQHKTVIATGKKGDDNLYTLIRQKKALNVAESVEEPSSITEKNTNESESESDESNVSSDFERKS